MKSIEIYTDGACRGNPGPGGWGALLKIDDYEKEISGGEIDTTNNRMELLAAIKALECVKEQCEINLYTDSKYVMKGITIWIIKWKANGFKNSKKKPVANADLWVLLDDLAQQYNIKWHLVKCHAGHELNERADALANNGLDNILLKS